MVFREQRKREAAEQYKLSALENADLHVNYEEDNYDAGARDAIEQFVAKAFEAGAEWEEAHPKSVRGGCKFCEGEKVKEWQFLGRSRKGHPKYGYAESVKPVDFGETCDLKIIGKTLHVDYDAYSCDSSFSNEITINFCPMCGKKLKRVETANTEDL